MNASGVIAGGTSREKRALLAVLVVTVIWGCSFVWMKQCIDAGIEQLGNDALLPIVLFFLTVRFGAAALLMPVVARKSVSGIDGTVWRSAILLSFLLVIGFVLQMTALEQISAPVSAFLTSLYVLFTAVLASLLTGHLPHRALVAGVLLATLGAGFISGPPQLHFDAAEWLTVGCAFIFAVHILAIDRITKRCDPLKVTFATCVGAAVLSVPFLIWVSSSETTPALSDLFGLLQNAAFVVPLGFMTVFATVLAFVLMNIWQRELSPVRAAILYAIEPIWAVLFAWSLGQAQLNGWLAFGGAALLAGNFVAELAPRWVARRRARSAQRELS